MLRYVKIEISGYRNVRIKISGYRNVKIREEKNPNITEAT